jgi:putative flippase GtrA
LLLLFYWILTGGGKPTFKKLISILKTQRELVSYLIFGGATTFVNWCVYGLVVKLAGFSITAGNTIAWVAAVVFAFITNKIFVFQSRSWQPLSVLREASAFLAARIVSGLIEIAGVPFLFYLGLNYPLLGIEGFAAKVIVSVIVVILNYFFSKLFIFRRTG